MAKALTLNDTQLTLLSSASRHKRGLLVRPEGGKASAAERAVNKLLTAGYIEKVVAASRTMPVWGEDDTGTPVSLRMTAAGLLAIGIKPEAETAEEALPHSSLAGAPSGVAGAPRTGTKRALVLDLLRRDEGATLADLAAATGWQPHTTWAALTGLRQRGHELRKATGDNGKAVYRLSAPRTGEALEQTGAGAA